MTTVAMLKPSFETPLAKGETAAVPSVAGAVRLFLRLEALIVFIGASLFYAHMGGGWLLYAALFFVPDLTMVAYLLGPRAGAVAYNVMHTYAGPGALVIAALLMGRPTFTLVGLVWAAHIGLDRALGYGLKYATGFGHTHLGGTGRGAARRA